MPYCKEEKIFIHNYLSSQSKNYIFYAFNSQSAQNAVHFTTSLHQDNNSLLTKIQTISSYVNASIGVISSNLLHQICGPYPTFSELYTDTLDDIVHTYLLPVLMIFVLITNFFVCLVLSRPHMRSPVFFLLFLIGIVELTNCCLPLPMYFAQSVYKRTAWWTDLPMRNFTSAINSLSGTDWELAPSDYYQTSDNVIASEASAWTTVFLPTITHTMSVWLTVALAIQRVINLTTNNIASKICNLTSTGRVFILILIISFILHWPLLSSRFILFQPIQLKSSIVENNLRVTNTTNSVQCLLNVVDNLPGIVMKCHLLQPVYMIFYFYARIVLIHILPCGILITLTIILVLKMHNIIKLRARLGLKNKNISYNSNQCKCKLFSCVCKKLNSTKESTSRVTSIPCKGNDSEIIRASYPRNLL
ncbi:putative rhodopsin-like orphan GPCR [Schistosoma japonicum]|uniref:Putative rhodopsin-like orphan GPCR n=1 Tax=Schistosoma japonicum TaxID=6182 RepID=A0A4Z2CYK2_SCHJA|nr:putative rhodopsin-like orphan GPCR [Schistosoma japonicum]